MGFVSGVRVECDRARGAIAHARDVLVEGRLAVAKDLYKKDLVCHYGCVNAIEFSQDGHYLVSGGDDRRVVLWRFGETLVGKGSPVQMHEQHSANVFCLAITNDNSRIFSGGYDNQVIAHDTETKYSVEMLPHKKSVYGIAIDSFDSRILSTAGEDGRLLLFDTRQSVEESLVVSRSRKAFHAVAFHPVQRGLLVAANTSYGATLWDLRKPKHPIIKYGYGNGSYMSQNCMSVRFDGSGNRILALRRRLPPVLYTIDSPDPLTYFYHPDYYNSCTVKSCCFVGDKDQYVLSGSDDFNLYMWEIPTTRIPTWVDKTRMVLYGHRSIVNQVRYNQKYCTIASSGVEKIIKLWSPLPIPDSTGSLMKGLSGPENPRDLYTQEDCAEILYSNFQQFLPTHIEQSTNEDPVMMARFDSLVQREIEGRSAEDTDTLSDDDVDPTMGSSYSRTRNAPPPNRYFRGASHKDSDSSDSDQMLIHFLRKKVPNGVRNQGDQNTIARLIARQSKLLRLAHKRFSPRYNKIQLTNISMSRANKKVRAARPLRARRGLRRGGSSPPLPSILINTPVESSPTASEPDSDTITSSRILQRNASKMTRLNRRRMSMPRNFRRKMKTINHPKNFSPHVENGAFLNESTRNDVQNNDEYLAIPSTSTGIRSHHNPRMFRIAEIDSDDDQSGSSCPKSPIQQPPIDYANLVNIIPTPINGSCRDFQNTNPSEPSSSRVNSELNNAETGNSIASFQLDLQNWDQLRTNASPLTNYSPTFARLRNEINVSEVESCCSTRSTADDAFSPSEMNPTLNLLAPSTSFGSKDNVPNESNNRDSPDMSEWIRQRQKIKRLRRNYRNHSKGPFPPKNQR